MRRSSSDRKSTRLNSSHSQISYAVFCLKKKRFACRTRQAHGAGSAVEPRLVQLPHANFEAIAFFAKQVFSRKREILKGQFADGRRMRAQRLESAASDA